jgi:hypothetical protein
VFSINVTIKELLEGVFSMQSACTPVRELQVVFKIPYVYDYITKLCRTQAELILHHVNADVRGIGHGDAMHGKCTKLKFGGGQAYDRSDH